MWRNDRSTANVLHSYRDHGPQAYGPTAGRLPRHMAPRQQNIATINFRSQTKQTYKRYKITTKKLWVVFTTFVLLVGFICIYFGLRAANATSSGAQEQTTSVPVDEATTASMDPITVTEETTITTAIQNVMYELDVKFESDMADSATQAFTRLETSACSEWEKAYTASGQTSDSCQLLSARPGSVVLELMLRFSLISSGVTPMRLQLASQVFSEQNSSFPAGSRCQDATIMNEFAVVLNSNNNLCSRTHECDNYNVCTPDDTSGVTCSCWEGYREVEFYGCVVDCMLANCLTCASTTCCMTCDEEYDLANDCTCQAKCEVNNCASCASPNVCNSCISHYALNTTGPSPVCNLNCTLANCMTCASPISCMTCDAGYELRNGGSCQAKCQVDNCASCTDPNVCNSCISHYVLDTTGPSPVCNLNCMLANCQTCASPTSCMTCNAGYELSNGGSCQVNCMLDNCMTCSSPTSCMTCDAGYEHSNGGSCQVNCTLANCMTCASPTSCMTCDAGYELSNGRSCQAKCEVDNCASCTDPNVCDSCILHYALNTTGPSSVCNLNCTLANCMTCASPTSCMTCDAGYELSNGRSCQAKCEVDNCASCTDPNVCDSCILHYALNTTGPSSVCNLNCTLANCMTCASPTSCMTCDAGYELSNGRSCQAKCEVDNCASCTDPNVCDSCILHYALNTTGPSSVCNLNCTLANCMTCASPTSCMTCDVGYELRNGGLCHDEGNGLPGSTCYSWCTAGCIVPDFCIECPFSYRVDPDRPGNCLSDCPFDNAINASEHEIPLDRQYLPTLLLEGNGPAGIRNAASSAPFIIQIHHSGEIIFPITRRGQPLYIYMYVIEDLHKTAGQFKYRQFMTGNTQELAVAKGYVCKFKDVFETGVSCSTCTFSPNWMLHLKIEDIPIDDMYASTVTGTLNGEVIVTSDGTENYAIGYYTSEPYGDEPAIEIKWGWSYTNSDDYGGTQEPLRKNRFALGTNVGITGVWVFKLPAN